MTATIPGEAQAGNHPADGPTRSPGERVNWGWGRWLWRTLTSMRTAIILLTLLAAAAVPGSILPQRNVASDPGAVIRYFNQHPTLAPWLDRFSMFDVYRSPWFAAIYLLLLTSMVGCVLPRCWKLWQSARTEPPRAPRHLTRLDHHREWETDATPAAVLHEAASYLKSRRFKVVADGDQVRSERGFLREVGNLIFHLSLLVLLLGIAIGRLYGFEGRIAIAEGDSFTNIDSAYDEFHARALTGNLEPFSFKLDRFNVAYETKPPKVGEPREFRAELTYETAAEQGPHHVEVSPNHPLDINGTKVFLTGNGYAPVVTVRDGRGRVVFSGPVLFLPVDGNNTSQGVVKAPDAKPAQLGFEGLFLPTADLGPQGPYSIFPGDLNPRLVLTAYTGDLGLNAGVGQSVFSLDKTGLTQVREDGKPFAKSLAIGETMTLPGGRGSLTFDRVARFANFQVAHDPGKDVSLIAALLLLLGVSTSLVIRRRRVWVRVRDASPTDDEQGADRTIVEIAALSLSRRHTPANEIERLARALDAPAPASTDRLINPVLEIPDKDRS